MDDEDNDELDPEYDQVVVDVFRYAGFLDEWSAIKKQLLLNMRVEMRPALNSYDHVLKKRVITRVDRALAARWSELSGRKVIFKGDEKPTQQKDPT